MLYNDCDISLFMSPFQVPAGIDYVIQRIGPVDDRLYLSGLDKVPEIKKVFSVYGESILQIRVATVSET